MSRTRQSAVVNVPRHVAYETWSDFEGFPRFMHGVERVSGRPDGRYDFEVRLAGRVVAFVAEVTEQSPDERIAWQSVSGRDTGGVVTFEALDAGRTRVDLELWFEPAGAIESLGGLVDAVGRQARADLENFKTFVEDRDGVGIG